MYPAIGYLENKYGYDDLPDELTMFQFIDGELNQIQMLKQPEDSDYLYVSEIFTPAVGDPQLVERRPVDSPNFPSPVWAGRRRFADQVLPVGVNDFTAPTDECLIYDKFQDPNAFYQDQFADTYTVSGPISGTVTRESICVLSGVNLRLTNFGYQWRVNGNNKSGDQNTPVGSYAGGYTVS